MQQNIEYIRQHRDDSGESFETIAACLGMTVEEVIALYNA